MTGGEDRSMTFYMCAIITTELLMAAMTLHVVHYSGFTKRQKTWFILTFASISVCSAAEFVVHCGYYDKKYAAVLTVITVLQFSIAPLLGVFFSGALGLHSQAKKSAWAFLLNAVVQIVAEWVRAVYSLRINGKMAAIGSTSPMASELFMFWFQ